MAEYRPQRSRELRDVDSCRDLAVVRRNGLRLRRKIVQAVAERPKRGHVVPAVHQARTAGRKNSRCRLRQRDHGPAAQQPDQARLVVAGYPARVARSRAFFLCVVHAIGCHAQPLSVH